MFSMGFLVMVLWFQVGGFRLSVSGYRFSVPDFLRPALHWPLQLQQRQRRLSKSAVLGNPLQWETVLEKVFGPNGFSVLGGMTHLPCLRPLNIFKILAWLFENIFEKKKDLTHVISTENTSKKRTGNSSLKKGRTGNHPLWNAFFLSASNLYLHVPWAVWQMAEERICIWINQWCPVRVHFGKPWCCHV